MQIRPWTNLTNMITGKNRKTWRKTKKKGIKKNKGNNCKQNANQTSDQLDKHDLGKNITTWAKHQKANKMEIKRKIKSGTNWTSMISEINNAKT